MSYQRVSEDEETLLNTKYRTTYFLTGPMPSNSAQGYMMIAIEDGVKLTGRAAVDDIEFIDQGHAALMFGSERPYNTWALRTTWHKVGGGSPLLLFTGPQGLITLAIIGVIVVVIGVVIVARVVEKEISLLGAPFKALFSPGTVVAAIVIIALIYGRKST